MADLQVQGVVHWSIPVNNLEESEKFYGEILGLESKGRLGGSKMSCFKAGSHDILLCERKEPLTRTPQQDNRLHHAFMVSPDMWDRGAKLLHEKGVKIAEAVVYREKGHFTGRELVLSRSERQYAGTLRSDLEAGHADTDLRRDRRQIDGFSRPLETLTCLGMTVARTLRPSSGRLRSTRNDLHSDR